MKKTITYLLVIIICFISLVPFLWMLKSSLQTMKELIAAPPIIFPRGLHFDNYVNGMRDYVPFLKYFFNSIVITVFIMIGHVSVSSLVAYPFSFLEFPGKKTLFAIMLATVMLPHAVTLVPLYLIFARLGWINTYLPLIVPAFLGWPFFIFLIRQFMKGIPQSLIDSSRMDGCEEPRIWRSIIIPLCKPALITVALFSIIGSWSDFLRPLLYIRDQGKYTITLGLQTMLSMEWVKWNEVMAVAVLSTLPPLLLFLFFQKYFIEGATFSGLKD